MSWKIEGWAADQNVTCGEEKHAPSARKFVLFMLASHSRHDGSCWAPQSKLAHWTGQSERAVRGHLAALEEGRFIRRFERRSKKDGHRLADGFLLDPWGDHGLVDYLDDLESMVDREGPGKAKKRDRESEENPQGLAADSAGRPTGKEEPPNRQISSALPADSAGIHSEDSLSDLNEPSPAEGSAGAPDGAATSDEAAPTGANQEQQEARTAYAFWKSQQSLVADHFGDSYGAWIKGLIALRYDADKKELVLGAYNQMAADKINGLLGEGNPANSYRARLADLLELEVTVIVYNLGAHQTARKIQRFKREREQFTNSD